MVTRTQSTSGLIDPKAPQWAQQLVLKLVGFFAQLWPTQPGQLFMVSKANLPPAAAWLGCTVYVTDIKKVAVSNGTAWTDPTGGAI